METTVITIFIGALSTVIIGLVQGLEDLKISGRVETIQTRALLRSEKISGDLKRLVVTKTPVRNHQLTLV